LLGLPKKTELKKQLPKNAIYAKFNMNTAAKDKFDADIKRILIVNEVSEVTTAIKKGEKVSSFFVLLVLLKRDTFDEKNIGLISKLINQNMLFILQYEGKSKLAIYHTKLMQTDWQNNDNLSIQLKGLNLDTVWENIIIQVGEIHIEQGNTLDEQIGIDAKYKVLQKKIESLEKQARSEKQPKRKFELVQEISNLKHRIESVSKKCQGGIGND
jgi:hypothetical protein